MTPETPSHAGEHPEPRLQVVDPETGCAIYTVWTAVCRNCRYCGIAFDTTIDEQYICNGCLARDIARAVAERAAERVTAVEADKDVIMEQGESIARERDALRARVAALTAELDAAVERERYWLRHKQHETGLRISAEARVAALTAALEEYGEHAMACHLTDHYPEQRDDTCRGCTCGYQASLDAAREG